MKLCKRKETRWHLNLHPSFSLPAQWDSPPLQTGSQEHRALWSCSTQKGERLALLILPSTTCCWHWFLDKCGQKMGAPLFLLAPLMRQRLYPEPCTRENTGALNTLASTSRVGVPARRGKLKRLEATVPLHLAHSNQSKEVTQAEAYHYLHSSCRTLPQRLCPGKEARRRTEFQILIKKLTSFASEYEEVV